jgi:hypothetical protein
MLHVQAASQCAPPCCMSLVHVCATCTRFVSLLYIRAYVHFIAAYPCCIFMMYVLAAYPFPCCISCHIQSALSSQPCTDSPVRAVLSRQSCPGSLVLPALFFLPTSACPVLPVLSACRVPLSCSACHFLLIIIYIYKHIYL